MTDPTPSVEQPRTEQSIRNEYYDLGFEDGMKAARSHPDEGTASGSEAVRTFPIQRFGSIPRWIAERAYIEYARRYGNRQSLDRLAERGGFGIAEMDELLPEWRALATPPPVPAAPPLDDAERLLRACALVGLELMPMQARAIVRQYARLTDPETRGAGAAQGPTRPTSAEAGRTSPDAVASPAATPKESGTGVATPETRA